jgi:uncharacterized protein with GYD domain
MPTFMCFLTWTDQGVKNVMDIGKRSKAASTLAEKLGGKIISAYVTTGHYDVVATIDLPSGDAMVKFAAALSAAGNVRTTTVRAYAPKEFAKLVADAPSLAASRRQRPAAFSWGTEDRPSPVPSPPYRRDVRSMSL